MNFIDSHAHVDAEAFDADREEVLARARAAGVSPMIVIGAGNGLDVCRRAIDLAESADDLYATVGVHPHDAGALEDTWWPELRELGGHERVVGIGETGLDYFYDHSAPVVQRKRFAEFLELAAELSKPVICHIRDAHADAREILQEHWQADAGGVIHCFTGTATDAAAYVEMGLYVSFSGIVTFKSASEIRAAVREVPANRILLETDCPYLAPVPRRGARNEPSFLPHTAAVVAREAGLAVEDLAARTVANTRSLFALT